jgi:hypothetical protein
VLDYGPSESRVKKCIVGYVSFEEALKKGQIQLVCGIYFLYVIKDLVES